MRERAIGEFESIFEHAAIPVLDIKEIVLARISAVLTGSSLDASILSLAGYLRERFAADVRVHSTEVARSGIESAKAGSPQPADEGFASTAELVGQVGIARSQLVLMADPDDERRVVNLDEVVQGTQPPILVIRDAVKDPAAVFGRILHCLTGNFRQKSNFEYSFTLVEEKGALVLLHTIDAEDIDAVRGALLLAPEIETEGERELLDQMAHHGERFLKAVVAAGRKMPYDVSYRLAVGRVVETVRGELSRESYGMLVVGHHCEGHSHIEAADYQLMHSVRDIPVLAL